LPADVRSSLETAMAEATKYANKIAQEENDKAMDEVRKSGKSQVVIPTAEQKKAMKKVLVKVHQQMASRIGKETIDTIYKETGFDPSKL